MTELKSQQCSLIDDRDTALTAGECEELSRQLDPRWELDRETRSLSHCFEFDNYYQTIAFVNVIAQIAHQQDHHPDMKVSYNRCKVIYSTHSIGGISIKDFICAAKINAARSL